MRELIVAGQAKPSFIVSHRLLLIRAADAYAHFDKRGTGSAKQWAKILLKPQETPLKAAILEADYEIQKDD